MTWHVSATGGSIGKLEVKLGETTAVQISDKITIRSGLRPRMAAMEISGIHGAGLSIYKNWKRIPVRYRVLDRSGGVLAQGDMTYG